MLYCLGLVLMALIGAYVAYILLREFLNKNRLSRYQKQGFAVKYNPFMGEIQEFVEGRKLKDENKPFEYLATSNKGAPGVVLNHSSGHKSWIHLIDTDLAREFLSMETEVCCRQMMLDIKASIGFITVGGEIGLKQRTIFSGIFSQKNLTRIAPQLRKIIVDHFGRSAITGSSDDQNVGKYKNSNEFLEGLMKEFTRDLIYHDSLPAPLAKSGLSPAEEFVKIAELVMSEKAGLHPLNLLLEGIPHIYNILPDSRKAHALGKDLVQLLKDFITKREEMIQAAGYDNYDSTKFNIIDAMILHNQEARLAQNPSEILTLDEMAGNCNLFTLASYDTTLTICSSVFFHLAQYPELQEELRSQIMKTGLEGGITSMDQIDDCELLTDVIFESLRIYPPGPFSFERLILKDFKLGKYQFYKGDLINVLVILSI